MLTPGRRGARIICRVGKPGWLGCCVIATATACGHVRFDPFASSDGSGGATGDGPPMLTCAGLAAICGPTGTSSCCDSPLVPGGTFYRSYDVGTDGKFPDMTNPATIRDFRLDAYEVTVGRFRQFVNAGMGTQASPPATGAGARTLNGLANQGGWDPTWNASLVSDTTTLVSSVKCDASYQSWTDAPGVNEALPMNCITWFEAFAFCAWDGGFVPAEAEWNYAAAGGDDQRAYPWSKPPSDLTIDCAHANYESATGDCVNPPTGGVNRVGSESPDGDGNWGQSDLEGNVGEWTLDWYAIPYANPCDECADTTPAPTRVIRGENFSVAAPLSLRGARRTDDAPSARTVYVGVRCARTAP